MDSSKKAATFLRRHAEAEENEVVYVLLLNGDLQLLGCCEVSHGSTRATVCEPEQIFRAAIAFGARSVIVAHNHPAGSVQPSLEDISATKRIIECGHLLGVQVDDHIILGSRGTYSSLRDSHGSMFQSSAA